MLKINHVAGLALVTMVATAPSAIAGEYQCQIFNSALRIAIEVKKEGHTLPCEVIAEDDRDGRVVLFSAQYDREYCPNRLEHKRTQLEEKGWVCNRTSEVNIVRQTDEPFLVSQTTASEESTPLPDGAVATASHSCTQGDGTRLLKIEVEDPDRGKPCRLVYWAEGDQSDEGQLLWRAEHDADFCTKRLNFIVDKWEGEGWQCNVGDRGPQSVDSRGLETAVIKPSSSEEAEATTPPASDQDIETSKVISPKLLEAVIDADAKRIGEWMEVEPDIEIAAHGDLNADGTDDAVVLLAYQSKESAYRQYMMSYLVADDTYELAGVKLLTGVNAPPAQARVQEIDNGIIWLSVPGSEGAGPEPVGYVLRDQQLVEIEPEERADSVSN